MNSGPLTNLLDLASYTASMPCDEQPCLALRIASDPTATEVAR